MSVLLAGMLVALGVASPATLAPQVTPLDDIRITSAIFGAREGSADVTPMVVHFTKPGLDEFYAAPFWLEVDPAVGQNKTLVVFYESRGKPHVLTTTEPGAMSRAILVDHATRVARPAPVFRDSTSSVTILNAYYGRGRTYAPATARVRELIQPAGRPFAVADAVLDMRPTAAANVLVMTYSYEGRRHSLVAWQGEQVSYVRLVAHADRPDPSTPHADTPPAWVKDARPDPPRQPGDPGPGVGRAPRREAGISELFKALAELEAIPTDQRRDAVARAIALTRSALANAQRNIGYPFPSPAAPPFEPRRLPASEHVTGATASLGRALNQLSAAGPGRGAAFLARSLSEIKAALAELSTLLP